jgi:outer membrane lipoprotein SlyB
VSAQALPSGATTGTTPARASGQVDDERAAPAAPKAAPVNTAPRTAAPKPAVAAKPPAAAERVAATCAQCGIVEAVTPFQQKGEGSGVGAVGGAVVGGLLGSQMGSGSGKKAMTVIGAVGGGLAGNEIEKRQRASTLYSVKVRMEDGSLRTITQSTAPAVGQKVTVDGSTLKARA